MHKPKRSIFILTVICLASTTLAFSPNHGRKCPLQTANKPTKTNAPIRASASTPGSGTGTATIPNEIFNLVKSIIGAGVFSLPAGIAAFGNAPSALVPACFLVTIMGVISAYTFVLTARVCAKTGASSYSQAWDVTRGTSSSWIVAASLALGCMALNLAYSLILADTFQGFASMLGIGASRNMVLGILTTFIFLPLCWMKNLSSLAPFSIVGLLCSAYAGLAIAIRYFGNAYKLPAGKFIADLATRPSFGSIGAKGALSAKTLILVSMLLTAYSAHFNAPKFYTELKENTIERFNIVASTSFGISIAFYCFVASLAFLTFGSGCSAMVLNNYSSKDLLLTASRFAVAISLVFSYPLVFQGSRDGLLDLMRVPAEKRTNGLLNKATLGLVATTTYIASSD